MYAARHFIRRGTLTPDAFTHLTFNSDGVIRACKDRISSRGQFYEEKSNRVRETLTYFGACLAHYARTYGFLGGQK